MSEREFIGIEDNECVFQGKVLADPQIQDGYAFLKLRCTTGELGANGQWTDTPMEIPLMASAQNVVRTITNHVKAERRLKVNCYYKSWVVDGQHNHAFIITRLKLGRKPYDGPKQGQGGQGPSVPPPNMG